MLFTLLPNQIPERIDRVLICLLCSEWDNHFLTFTFSFLLVKGEKTNYTISITISLGMNNNSKQEI